MYLPLAKRVNHGRVLGESEIKGVGLDSSAHTPQSCIVCRTGRTNTPAVTVCVVVEEGRSQVIGASA